MHRFEEIFRRVVIWFARKIPYETAGLTTICTFIPPVLAFLFVPPVIEMAATHPVLGPLTDGGVRTWILVAIFGVVGFGTVCGLCRLLQICDEKYFSIYEVEDQHQR